VSEDGAADPPAVDPVFAAFLIRLNSMADTLFTLVKFATTYLDQAPPAQGHTTNGSNGSASVPMLADTGNVDYTRPRHFDAVQKRDSAETETSVDALRQYIVSLNSQLNDLHQLIKTTAAKLKGTVDNMAVQRRQSSTPASPAPAAGDWYSPFKQAPRH
jgi:hypothetical protein